MEDRLDNMKMRISSISDIPPSYRNTVLLPQPSNYQEALSSLSPPPVYEEVQRKSIEKNIYRRPSRGKTL